MSTRINITKEDIEKVIPTVNTLLELSNHFGCAKGTMRRVLDEYNMYVNFMKSKGLPYKPVNKEPCCICGSTFRSSTYKGKVYCKKHYSQATRNRFLNKTIYDTNDFEFNKDTCKIILRNIKQNISGVCFIDKDDFDLVKNYKWFLNRHGYCVTKSIDHVTNTPIHKVLMEYSDNLMCDHIDNNPLNNKRSNLRIVSPRQNSMNMSRKSTNQSGVAGVSKYTRDSKDKWTAVITVNYESIYLGRYTSFDECVKARLLGEANYYQEFSNHYNPDTRLIELLYISQDDSLEKFVSVNINTKSIVDFHIIKEAV